MYLTLDNKELGLEYLVKQRQNFTGTIGKE